jgi:hypothetical protein
MGSCRMIAAIVAVGLLGIITFVGMRRRRRVVASLLLLLLLLHLLLSIMLGFCSGGFGFLLILLHLKSEVVDCPCLIRNCIFLMIDKLDGYEPMLEPR